MAYKKLETVKGKSKYRANALREDRWSYYMLQSSETQIRNPSSRASVCSGILCQV